MTVCRIIFKEFFDNPVIRGRVAKVLTGKSITMSIFLLYYINVWGKMVFRNVMVLMLAAALLGPVSAQFKEGFESGNLTAGQWGIEGNITVVTDLPHSGACSARNSNAFKLRKSFKRITSGILEFSVYLLVKQTNKNACSISFWNSQDPGEAVAKVYPRYHGTFYALNGQDKNSISDAYKTDIWYKIYMVINLDSQTYDIYINDHLAAKQFKFYRSTDGIDMLLFDCLETSGSVAYFDDITLSAEGTTQSANDYFIEDFESGNLSANGWITQGNITITSAKVHGESFAAKNNNSFFLQKYFSAITSGLINFTVYMLLDQTDKNACSITFWDSSSPANSAIKVYPRYYGTFHAFDGPDRISISDAYRSNYWYKIQIIMNVSNQKYDVYLNDRLAAFQFKFNGTFSKLDMLQFDCLETSGATAYLDDLYLSAHGLGAPQQQNVNLDFNQIDASQFPSIYSYVSLLSPYGFPIQGLTTGNFTVRENSCTAVVNSVAMVGSGTVPICTALIVDRSGSMSGGKLQDAQSAACTFVNQLSDIDRAAVISFSTTSQVNQTFTSTKSALINAINSLSENGSTAAWDACIDGINHTTLQTNRKALILLSDGDDNASSNTLDNVIAYAGQHNTPIFVIGLGITGGSPFEASLKKLASSTGGHYYAAPTSADLLQIYQLLTQQLQSQYKIVYTSCDPTRNGANRTVQLNCTYQGTSVQQSKTYQAPSGGAVNTPELTIDCTTPQLAGNSFWLEIRAGSAGALVSDLFGISFELNYSPTAYVHIVSPTTLSLVPGSLVGPAGNLIYYSDVNESAGRISVGLSRKSGASGVNGSGTIYQVHCITDASIPSGTTLHFSLSNVRAIDSKGAPITLISADKIVSLSNSAVSVWPGDMDNNGLVDQADVFPIGLYWGKIGSARNNPNFAWSAQACTIWSPISATYADASGDGLVDQADVMAIGFNWGKSHTRIKNLSVPTVQKTAVASLQCNSLAAYYAPRASFTFTVQAVNTNDLFGISLILVIDRPDILKIDSVLVMPWFASDYIEYHQIDNTTGRMALGVSRKSGQTGVYGNGPIFQIKAHIADTAPLNQSVTLTFDAVKAINVAGQSVGFTATPAVVQIAESMVVSKTADNMPESSTLIRNYPNPFNQGTKIEFVLKKATWTRLRVFNPLGQVVAILRDEMLNAGSHSLDWAGLDSRNMPVPGGVYFLELRTAGETCRQKITMLQ
jgi:VWFA-related protein